MDAGQIIRRLATRAAIFPLALILVVFFASMSPLIATRVIDTMNFERYYTDAALSMLHSGDYLTPVQGDGTVRLHKPMLTYWTLVASFKLFGISFFTSRLPFLLVACATIALTYKVCMSMRIQVRGATTAAVILASNLLFICVAIRAIQDVLLTFALLLSAYGFFRLICLNKIESSSYWLAYGGAALGIAVKGLLPLVFLTYAFVFAFFAAPRERLFTRLVNLPVMIASMAIALLPSGLLAWKHGTGAVWHSFWTDQVAGKTSLSGSVLRIAGYLLVYLVCFAPWFVAFACLAARRATFTPLTIEQRKTCTFIVLWAVLLAIIFGLGDRVHNRYLVPAVPLISIALAINFTRFSDANLSNAFRPILNTALAAIVLLALFGAVVLFQNHFLTTHLAGAIIVGLTALGVAARVWPRHVTPAVALSMSMLILLLLCLAILAPFTLPDQTTQIADALNNMKIPRQIQVLVGNDKLSSRLRVATAARYDIRLRKLSPQGAPADSIDILTQGEARRGTPAAGDLRVVATYPSRLSPRRLIRAVFSGSSNAYIDSCKVHCYLAGHAAAPLR